MRVSQKFNLERDPESRNALQAAGPTGPRDHTSLRVGCLYYHGKNQQNFGRQTIPVLRHNQRTVLSRRRRSSVQVSRKLELFGRRLVRPRQQPWWSSPERHLPHWRPAVTYYRRICWCQLLDLSLADRLLRYDFVNSHSDFLNGASRSIRRATASARIPGSGAREYQGRRRISVSLGAALHRSRRQETLCSSARIRSSDGIDYVF